MDSIEALKVLDLCPGASYNEIRQAYRDLVKVWHPDRFGSDERLRAKALEQIKLVNEAYQWLQVNYDPAATSAGAAQSSPNPSAPAQDGPTASAPGGGERSVKCPNCHQQTKADNFCQYCGTQLGSGGPTTSVDGGQMILLLALNFLWNGIGNVVIGDKRGWKYILLNIVLFVIGLATAFIPVVLFYAYCGYQGYLHLESVKNQAAAPTQRP